MLNKKGQKPLDMTIGGLLLLVAIVYVAELLFAHPSGAQLTAGILVPTLNNSHQIYLAAGILGATVIPQVIYLHSALFKNTYNQTVNKRLRSTKFDVSIAMVIAYRTLEPLVGKAASILFGVSLIASGLSSTVVGTMAGQVVMQGFVRITIPMWLRRSITMAPSFFVIGLGINTTQILVMSQVTLSFGIALAIIPLVLFTASSDIMGRHTNSKTVTTAGSVIIGLVLLLNAYLLTTLI
ncbi:Manganese transport protein MntH [Vibrio fluvialis PG41]|uniref:Manganese transport protein MntH n=1 Tax=Vibrio fluvialis PG41 TaxID=1336752 RepID=S7JB09_VIBFL|nr:Manganese transport protein MntH [Vibrio fluvialis PG41]